jgi:hypothetical protein
LDNKNNNNSNDSKPEFLECKDCKIKFDDMAERQRHILSEHIQKGDFPKEKEID